MNVRDELKAFKTFLRGIDFSKPEDKRSFDYVHFVRRNKHGLIFYGNEKNLYVETLSRFSSKLVAKEVFSSRTLEKLFQQATFIAYNDQRGIKRLSAADIARGADWLERALKATDRSYIHFIPIDGLDLQYQKSIKIGKVIFHKVTPKVLDRIKHPTAIVVDSFTDRPYNSKDYLNNIYTKLKENFNGRVMAEVETLAGDTDVATSKALKTCRDTVDAINFYGDIIEVPSHKTCIGIYGDLLPAKPKGKKSQSRTLAVLKEKYDEEESSFEYKGRHYTGYNFNHSVIGPLFKMSLPSLHTEYAKEIGLDRVSDLLAKEDRNDLNNRILGAVQWAGRATAMLRREEAFLLSIIALESLVMGKTKVETIGPVLRQRTCQFLGCTPEQAKNLSSVLSKLYDTRSKIVHSGSFQVTDSDLSLAREIAKTAAIYALTLPHFVSMTDVQQLEDWFNADAADAPDITESEPESSNGT